jgi:hypothetical protein
MRRRGSPHGRQPLANRKHSASITTTTTTVLSPHRWWCHPTARRPPLAAGLRRSSRAGRRPRRSVRSRVSSAPPRERSRWWSAQPWAGHLGRASPPPPRQPGAPSSFWVGQRAARCGRRARHCCSRHRRRGRSSCHSGRSRQFSSPSLPPIPCRPAAVAAVSLAAAGAGGVGAGAAPGSEACRASGTSRRPRSPSACVEPRLPQDQRPVNQGRGGSAGCWQRG